jgi:predicted aminopeptidase
MIDDAALRYDVMCLQLWLERRYGCEATIIAGCHDGYIANVTCVCKGDGSQNDAERVLAALGWDVRMHTYFGVVDMIRAEGFVDEPEKSEMIGRADDAYRSTLSNHELIHFESLKY